MLALVEGEQESWPEGKSKGEMALGFPSLAVSGQTDSGVMKAVDLILPPQWL